MLYVVTAPGPAQVTKSTDRSLHAFARWPSGFQGNAIGRCLGNTGQCHGDTGQLPYDLATN